VFHVRPRSVDVAMNVAGAVGREFGMFDVADRQMA
jgi:hypothetical protein